MTARMIQILIKGLTPLLIVAAVFGVGFYTGQKRSQVACELRVVQGVRESMAVSLGASQDLYDAAQTTFINDALTQRVLQEISDAASDAGPSCNIAAERLRVLDALTSTNP